MSVQDLSIWHDRRTAGNAYRRGGHLSFQQLDRATDHAEASVSVAGAAVIPSARQLGSSTNSRSEPKRVARMLRAHEPLILNWFRAKGEICNGAVEGLNNKIRVVTRRSYGFRTFDAMEIALYHNLGRLPEPESPHKFC